MAQGRRGGGRRGGSNGGEDEPDLLDSFRQALTSEEPLDLIAMEPLPDEDFAWAGIPEDARPVVAEMLERCDGCAEALLDVEHRTAMRRFLSRAAAADPALFRRRASPVRGAPAIAWAVCQARIIDNRDRVRDEA